MCFYNVVDYIKKACLKNGKIYKIARPSTYHISSSIKMIEWAKIHPNFVFSQKLARNVTRSDNLYSLKYLKKHNCVFCPEMYCDAINNDNIKIIKWLFKKGVELNEYAFHEAAKGGNIYILKLLKKYNCEYNSVTCNNAIIYQNLDCLKWLLKNGCFIDTFSFAYAVETGNLNIIEYLYDICTHDLSFPWRHSNCCTLAAKKGYIDVLIWLRTRYISWNIDTILVAIENNNYNIAKWAVENGCYISRSLYTHLCSLIHINESMNIKFID